MHRLIVQTYAYEGRGEDDFYPLIVAYAIDQEDVQVVNLTDDGGRVPLELRAVLADAAYVKYSMDPQGAYKVLSTFMPYEGRAFRSHWFLMGNLLNMLGYPDDLNIAMKLMGKGVSMVGDIQGCINRFCKPDPVFGRKTEPEEFMYQWQAFIRIAGWQVHAMRYILDKFVKSLYPYVRNRKYRRTFSFDIYPVDMNAVEESMCENDRSIERGIHMHNKLVMEEADREDILTNACNLREALRQDYSWMKAHIKDGHFERPYGAEEERYCWIGMVFDTAVLQKEEELILLDYSGSIPTVLRWLGTDPKSDKTTEILCEDLRIAIWQAMNSAETIYCNRIRLVRKQNFLILSIPSGDRVIFPYPSYYYNGEQWVLEYNGFVDGRLKRVRTGAADIVKKMAMMTLQAYMATRLSLVNPREQLLLCAGTRMILKLQKGKRFMTDRPLTPHRMWLRKLSLSPKITYRSGGAYGE